jgi:hypothetical protein
MSRKAWIAIGVTFGFLLFLGLQNRNGEVKSSRLFAAGPGAPGAALLFDVNDVSYLWPVPKTKDDVVGLMSVDDKLADGTSQVWPLAAFNSVVQTAQTVTIQNSAGLINGSSPPTRALLNNRIHGRLWPFGSIRRRLVAILHCRRFSGRCRKFASSCNRSP